MTAMTRSELLDDLAAKITDNTAGENTAERVRELLTNLIDSVLVPTSDKLGPVFETDDIFEFKAADDSVQFEVGATLGAVNRIRIVGSDSPSYPTLVAVGADDDIGFGMVAKGEGGFFFGNGTGYQVKIGGDVQVFGDFAAGLGNNNTSLGDYSLVGGSECSANGDYAFSFGFQSNATGLDGLAFGRNANATAEKAIAVGSGAAASSYGALAIGVGVTADAQSAVALGQQSHTKAKSVKAFAAGRFSANGDAQLTDAVLRTSTTDATAKIPTYNDSNSGFHADRLQANSAVHIEYMVVAREASTGDVATWQGRIVARRGASAATTAILSGSLSSVFASTNASTWTAVAAADTTNGSVKVTVTGQAAKSIKWVVTSKMVEVVG